MSARRIPISDRFWKYVTPGDTNDCWIWQGSKCRDGYGQMKMTNDGIESTRRATAVSLELHGVNVPKGSMVMHTCDNPPCVNPNHLRVGTAKENNLDRSLKGRWRGRQTKRGVPLTSEEVREIRSRYSQGFSPNSIAASFGISASNVRSIKNRRTWKHI